MALPPPYYAFGDFFNDSVSITPFNVTFTDDPLRDSSYGNRTEEAAAGDRTSKVVIAVCITALYSLICVVGLLGNVLVMYGVVR